MRSSITRVFLVLTISLVVTSCSGSSRSVNPETEALLQELTELQTELEGTYEELRQLAERIDSAYRSVVNMHEDVITRQEHLGSDIPGSLVPHVNTLLSSREHLEANRRGAIERIQEEVNDLQMAQLNLDSARQALGSGQMGETRRLIGIAEFDIGTTMSYLNINAETLRINSDFLCAAARSSYAILLEFFESQGGSE